MKLVVGLGNPGKEYVGTRHNLGFAVVEYLIGKHQLNSPRDQFGGLCTRWEHHDSRVLLLQPMTFMNRSGECVRAVVDFFKIELADILLLSDDLDIPFGGIRMRPKGSGGGQRGLVDVLAALNTTDVARVRVGIGRPAGQMSAADYVLQRFGSGELDLLPEVVDRVVAGVELWVSGGCSVAMNFLNRSTSP